MGEAQRSMVGVSKNTLDDLKGVSKSTFGDLTKSAKEVAAKKGLLKVSTSTIAIFCFLLSNMKLNTFCLQGLSITDREVTQSQQPPPVPSTSLVQSDPTRSTGRDFFSNISSDLNGIAAQTSSMFSDLFGKSSSPTKKPFQNTAF